MTLYFSQSHKYDKYTKTTSEVKGKWGCLPFCAGCSPGHYLPFFQLRHFEIKRRIVRILSLYLTSTFRMNKSADTPLQDTLTEIPPFKCSPNTSVQKLIRDLLQGGKETIHTAVFPALAHSPLLLFLAIFAWAASLLAELFFNNISARL